MLRFISVVVTAAFFAAGAFAQEKSPANAATAEENQASARASLRGVWKVTESLTYTVEIEGNMLRMTIMNPPFAPGRERRTVLTRVE